jgi:hypothetical protein
VLVLQSSPPEGSVLFSYVQTDEFCERFEASRCITTSKWEGQNHLARKLATDARNRQKVRQSVTKPNCLIQQFVSGWVQLVQAAGSAVETMVVVPG